MTSSIPEHARALCAFCGLELNTKVEGVHQFSTGWVKNRSGGGAHGLSLQQRENKWAHSHCIDKEIRGHTNQGSMF